MRLARIVFRDSPWWLEDDTETNPEVGTVVQVSDCSNEDYDWEYAVYFPGSQSACIISPSIFNLYFEWLE